MQVRERIRINGQPVSPELFTKHFWRLYHRLEETKVRTQEGCGRAEIWDRGGAGGGAHGGWGEIWDGAGPQAGRR